MKVYLYYEGKPRNAHANAMAEEFVKRTSRFARVEMREIHPARFEPWARHATARVGLLDPAGRRMSSAEFLQIVEKSEMEGRDLVFVVGGAEGLPGAWRSRAELLISLSPMTFPHELARVMLAEQIYRAFATLRGHPYPR